MKKYFLSIFILFLLIQALAQSPLTFAAAATTGETWTWIANGQIQVTGGQTKNPGPVPSNDQGAIEIKDPNGPNGSCTLFVMLQLSADKKSAIVNEGPAPQSPIEQYLECTTDITKQYYGTTIKIGGTPTTVPVGLNLCPTGQYAFDVTYFDGNATSIPPAPASLTFAIDSGNPQQTSKGTVENGAFGVNVDYSVSFCLTPGAHKVCIQPLQPDFSCSNFTMPKAPYSKTFGKQTENDDVFVGVILLNSDSPGPYKVELQQSAGTTLQTTTTSKAANQGTECALVLEATLFKVKPGNYSVCIPNLPGGGSGNTCENLTQVAGLSGTVTFNQSQIETNGQSACTTTPLPPPPSPPCDQWSNGQCTTFDSALGIFSTDPEGFIQKIFAVLLSISGGIALLLIIRAGYQLMISQGKPEQIQQGRDQLIAAIVGLVFLIFSFIFLQLIGFDILHIPGFSGPDTNTGGTCQPSSCIQTSLCTAKNPGHCNTNGCPSGQSCVQ